MDLDDWPYCNMRCPTCRTDHRFKGTSSIECCGHRYVGEDLFRCEEYYGEHEHPDPDYDDDLDDDEESLVWVADGEPEMG